MGTTGIGATAGGALGAELGPIGAALGAAVGDAIEAAFGKLVGGPDRRPGVRAQKAANVALAAAGLPAKFPETGRVAYQVYKGIERPNAVAVAQRLSSAAQVFLYNAHREMDQGLPTSYMSHEREAIASMWYGMIYECISLLILAGVWTKPGPRDQACKQFVHDAFAQLWAGIHGG
jgi:hypothetical protein